MLLLEGGAWADTNQKLVDEAHTHTHTHTYTHTHTHTYTHTRINLPRENGRVHAWAQVRERMEELA